MQGSDHDSDNCCLPDLFRHLQWAKPFPSHLNLLHAAMNPSPPNVSIAFKVQEWPEEVTGSNPRKISDGPLPHRFTQGFASAFGFVARLRLRKAGK